MYYGKDGHLEKKSWRKGYKLEEKVKKFEGYVSYMHRSIDNFSFQVGNSQVFLSHTLKNE